MTWIGRIRGFVAALAGRGGATRHSSADLLAPDAVHVYAYRHGGSPSITVCGRMACSAAAARACAAAYRAGRRPETVDGVQVIRADLIIVPPALAAILPSGRSQVRPADAMYADLDQADPYEVMAGITAMDPADADGLDGGRRTVRDGDDAA